MITTTSTIVILTAVFLVTFTEELIVYYKKIIAMTRIAALLPLTVISALVLYNEDFLYYLYLKFKVFLTTVPIFTKQDLSTAIFYVLIMTGIACLPVCCFNLYLKIKNIEADQHNYFHIIGIILWLFSAIVFTAA